MKHPPHLQRTVWVKDAVNSYLSIGWRWKEKVLWAFPYSDIHAHVCYISQSPTAPQPRSQSFTPLPGDQVGVNAFPLHFSALSLLHTGWCQEHVRSKTGFVSSGRTMSSAAWDLLCCRANVLHCKMGSGLWASLLPSPATTGAWFLLKGDQAMEEDGHIVTSGFNAARNQKTTEHTRLAANRYGAWLRQSQKQLHWQHSTSHIPNLSLFFSVTKQYHRLQFRYSFKIKCTSTKPAPSNIYRATSSGADLRGFLKSFQANCIMLQVFTSVAKGRVWVSTHMISSIHCQLQGVRHWQHRSNST